MTDFLDYDAEKCWLFKFSHALQTCYERASNVLRTGCERFANVKTDCRLSDTAGNCNKSLNFAGKPVRKKSENLMMSRERILFCGIHCCWIFVHTMCYMQFWFIKSSSCYWYLIFRQFGGLCMLNVKAVFSLQGLFIERQTYSRPVKK